MTTSTRIAKILNIHVALVEMLMSASAGSSLSLQYQELWVAVNNLADLETIENGE